MGSLFFIYLGNDLKWRLHSALRAEAAVLSDVTHVLIEIDRCCDQLGMPQAAESMWDEETEAASLNDAVSPECPQFTKEPGRGVTFLVDVRFRQHWTIQGTVHWLEGAQKIPFRSGLELLNLMGDALGLPAGTDLSLAESESPVGMGG